MPKRINAVTARIYIISSGCFHRAAINAACYIAEINFAVFIKEIAVNFVKTQCRYIKPQKFNSAIDRRPGKRPRCMPVNTGCIFNLAKPQRFRHNIFHGNIQIALRLPAVKQKFAVYAQFIANHHAAKTGCGNFKRRLLRINRAHSSVNPA